MRDLLTAQETARILGKRIDSLYNIVDAFNAKGDDEWELVEGEHFEFAGPAVAGAKRRRPRRFSEEGVEALARYIEATEKTGVLGWFRERLFNVKQKRKQLLCRGGSPRSSSRPAAPWSSTRTFWRARSGRC